MPNSGCRILYATGNGGTAIKVLDPSEASNFGAAQSAAQNGQTSFSVTGSLSGNTCECGYEVGSGDCGCPTTYENTFTLGDYGDSLKDVDSGVKLNVFKHYASTYCPNAEVSLNISGNAAAGVWSQPSTGQQHLEVNPDCNFNFDEKDIKAVMKHESGHIANEGGLESQNIINTAKSTEFKNSSTAFKNTQIQYLLDSWEDEDPGLNRTESDAREALGL